MADRQHKFSIFSPLFSNLFQRFMTESRYEIYRVSRIHGDDGEEKKVRTPVDTPASFGVFLEAFFVFFISVVTAARRVTVFHVLDFFILESPRRKGRFTLRLKPHTKITKFLGTKAALLEREPDYSEDTLYATSAEVYNELLDVVKRRDTIVVTRTES